MKEKTISIKVRNMNQGQWSNLLLELNMVKKAWKRFGVDINLKAPGFKSVLKWGSIKNDYTRSNRSGRYSVQPNKRPKV